MTDKKLSTESYKGVRDFYPEEAAIQQYIFNTWSKTAESFGFERYNASIFEPSDLYKAKGAENEEMVNEQTYTFTDRGEREVTLRPEMTPTVARMVAGKARELAFPLRWYSIPNLFRYERQQKGRMREHWQLNCDIFGSDSVAADVEVIALAYQTMIDFGAKPEQFEIQINDRQLMHRLYIAIGVEEDLIPKITKLNDRRDKISDEDYRTALLEITNDEILSGEVIMLLDKSDEQTDVVIGLEELGITNVVFNKSLARGFDYYTGTIFEIFERDSDGNSTGRSMLGGGRYDNLTSMFGGEPVSGIGFGMGDVTMRDFLETHELIPDSIKSTAANITIIPETAGQHIFAQSIAQQIRQTGTSVSTDIGTQKIDKKKVRANERGSKFIIVIGENEVESKQFTAKKLETGEEFSGQLPELIVSLLK
jgi:histidyl-tRNA synthetase